jgi:peptidoglycan hydrolase-like protein with peptidoglycan-binding domain
MHPRIPWRRAGRLSTALAVLITAAGLAAGSAVAAPASAQTGADATALCDRTISIGDSGPCVERLQRRLNELGLDCGNRLAVDGDFGRLTRMRVFAFQGRNRIEVDGIVGPITRGKLANPDEGLGVSCEADIAQLIRQTWPDGSQDKAIRVARCESALNPIAVGGPNSNGSLDFGVFQFNDGGTLQAYLPGDTFRAKVDAALHAESNIRAALALWRDRGWQPWTCGDA